MPAADAAWLTAHPIFHNTSHPGVPATPMCRRKRQMSRRHTPPTSTTGSRGQGCSHTGVNDAEVVGLDEQWNRSQAWYFRPLYDPGDLFQLHSMVERKLPLAGGIGLACMGCMGEGLNGTATRRRLVAQAALGAGSACRHAPFDPYLALEKTLQLFHRTGRQRAHGYRLRGASACRQALDLAQMRRVTLVRNQLAAVQAMHSSKTSCAC